MAIYVNCRKLKPMKFMEFEDDERTATDETLAGLLEGVGSDPEDTLP